MQAEEAKMILRYMGGIEAQLYDVNRELAELQDRYNPIKGMGMDGMPHGTTPGDSTASLAVKLADSSEEYKRTENRLLVRRGVLLADRDNIRDQLDRMNGDYKIILRGRYVYTQKSLQRGWTSIAAELGVKEITAQRKEKVALAILGPMLDEMPMAEEILLRAYDARD